MSEVVELEAVGVDLRRIAEWLRNQGVCDAPFSSVRRIPGGSQNVLVLIECDGREMVLRRPPVHKRADSDDTMRREAFVLRALADTSVPHPRLLAACTDLDVTGAAFYVMERVRGTDIDTALASADDAAAMARATGFSIAEAAADLAAVEWPVHVLEGLGRRDDWLERQVGRWRKQLDSYGNVDGYTGPADLGPVDEIGAWLDRHRPNEFTAGLIHGDFHLGNLMYADDRAGVAAIVDWELASVGDPLLDLAHMLATWPDGRSAPAVRAELPHLPSADEMVGHYESSGGRDVADIHWYRVLACYRLGIIVEGTKARSDAGKAPRDVGDRLHEVAVKLFAQARALTLS